MDHILWIGNSNNKFAVPVKEGERSMLWCKINDIYSSKGDKEVAVAFWNKFYSLLKDDKVLKALGIMLRDRTHIIGRTPKEWEVMLPRDEAFNQVVDIPTPIEVLMDFDKTDKHYKGGIDGELDMYVMEMNHFINKCGQKWKGKKEKTTQIKNRLLNDWEEIVKDEKLKEKVDYKCFKNKKGIEFIAFKYDKLKDWLMTKQYKKAKEYDDDETTQLLQELLECDLFEEELDEE